MRRLASILLLAVLAAGCTSGGSDEPSGGSGPSDQPRDSDGASASASPVPTGPDCSSVWKAGDDLPADYDLCVADGEAGVQEVTDCVDGPPLIVFDDELYGRPGEQIEAPTASPVQDTEEYGKAYAECTGE